MILRLLASALIGYLLGAIPSGVIVARLWGGDSVLHTGSGHTGGTNVARATGNICAGLISGLMDVGWAVLGIVVARELFGDGWPMAMAAAGAVIGHNWSVYIGWRGGVGLSSLVGLLVTWSPLNAVWLIALFVVVWLGLRKLIKHDARASLIALPVLPIAALIGTGPSPMVAGLAIGALAAMARTWMDWHRQYQGGEGFLSQVGIESDED